MKSYLFIGAGLMMAACTPSSSDTSIVQETLSANIAWQNEHARFTVVADGVIRMEWTPDGQFVDQPSFLATERSYPKAEYVVTETDKELVITTSSMKLCYQKSDEPFSADNLSITASERLTTPFTWHPGDQQTGNLKGTYRTLDGYDGDRYYAWNRKGDGSAMPLEDGLLATDGWTWIDDSQGLLFDANPNDTTRKEFAWVEERPASQNRQDWFFMAYGHDYKQALSDYTLFAGRIPLPPRYVFGYWWSRYWSYSDAEMRQVVKDFETFDIPLDVLVVDMDWHWTEPGKGGWTGYTWNDRLFPNPAGFLQYLKNKNLQITLNLHPADGVPAYEDKYAALAEYLGRDPKSQETIAWQSSDKKMMTGWFEKMLRPLEKEGVTFWWLDWQQGLMDEKIKSLSNTWWLNYCTFTDQLMHADHRPMLYHRWGGMGNHRYQIGFSGDTYSTWASLDYQPYFNHTSSNVGYGYWSHDLGGHMFVNDGDQLDRELYIRWMQFGTFSPVMRSHSTKDAAMNKEPWALGRENQDILHDLVHLRYKLAPYIYTMARQSYETGVSLCRPLYYDYPEDAEAYASEFRNEYMFGDQILVAPITTPMADGKQSLVKIWLPAGNDWYEWQTGTLLKGGQIVERHFLIDEYPVYVKAGAIVPMYNDKVYNLRSNDEEIIYAVFPTSQTDITSACTFYEDQGTSKDYATHYATTKASMIRSGQETKFVLSARQGAYEEMPVVRPLKLSLIGNLQPESVTLDGKTLTLDQWKVDTDLLTLTIDLGQLNPAVSHEVIIKSKPLNVDLNQGLVAQIRRMKRTMTAMKYRHAGINYIEGLGQMGSLAEALQYFPNEAEQRISDFQNNYQNLPTLLEKQQMKEVDRSWFLLSVLW